MSAINAHPASDHRFPRQFTAIIGHKIELAGITRLLRDRGCRSLTPVDHSGAGKTRLALEAARRNANDQIFSMRNVSSRTQATAQAR